MKSKLIFVRRTPKEIEVFGGEIFIDINGKNKGKLGTSDFIIELNSGDYKLKMYKSHTYDTFIGIAESEIHLDENETLVIRYSSPMISNQPGNIIVKNINSVEEIDEIVKEKDKTITNSINETLQKSLESKERDKKSNNAWVIFIIIFIIFLIIEFTYIFSI